MKEQDFLIIGGGTQGRLIVEILNETRKDLNIIQAVHHTDITDETNTGIIAIKDNRIREKVVKYVLDLMPDFHFRWTYHPTAIIEKGAKIGKGTMIMGNAFIGSGAIIGEHCLINTGAIVDNDAKIGNFVNVGTGGIVRYKANVSDFEVIVAGGIRI